jgi:hypothetical protein
MNFVQGENLNRSKWHTHVEEWMTNPYKSELLIIKYEDLKQNTVHELKRFCEFIGIERDEKVLNFVSEKTSFSKMATKEKKLGWNNPVEINRKKGTSFVRRGKIGSYKDEMPSEVLEIFMLDAASTLSKHGYML